MNHPFSLQELLIFSRQSGKVTSDFRSRPFYPCLFAVHGFLKSARRDLLHSSNSTESRDYGIVAEERCSAYWNVVEVCYGMEIGKSLFDKNGADIVRFCKGARESSRELGRAREGLREVD